MVHQVLLGDCLEHLERLKAEGHAFDLIYLDPPFGTQKKHTLTTRDGRKKFEYQDIWQSQDEYRRFLYDRLYRLSDCLKETGSLFFHCDSSASHIARGVLDEVFGAGAFVSEIVWAYRRWSNSQKGLIPSHQLIYFYAKTKAFKFNQILTDYSETTNADQILQRRIRDERGKAVYERDEAGDVIPSGAKRGVPLGDVWEIPYLNPKATERVGYPTQKPILLLERILDLVTLPGDWVLDPFCGSGTTLVAAKLNGRNAIGIDQSADAVSLAKERLQNPTKTDSSLLKSGRVSYLPKEVQVHRHLAALDYVPIARNKGIDGILKDEIDGRPVLIRVQRANEALEEAASSLKRAARGKGNPVLIVVRTHQTNHTLFDEEFDKEFDEEGLTDVRVIPSMELLLVDSVKVVV
jgi:site-specific DNA-methyltransferase (adenine-specific)